MVAKGAFFLTSPFSGWSRYQQWLPGSACFFKAEFIVQRFSFSSVVEEEARVADTISHEGNFIALRVNKGQLGSLINTATHWIVSRYTSYLDSQQANISFWILETKSHNQTEIVY